MATFLPVVAGGDSAWGWHLLAEELRQRDHELVADLPARS